jgi:hypothetical protein
MERRKLGALEVSALGLGCATMTPFYGQPDAASAIDTIRRACELGIDFLDTSDAYGNGRNEELISRAVGERRHDYVIASKFGNLRPAGIRQDGVRAQPATAADRSHRSLLHSPGRSVGADRGHGRRDERTRPRGQGAFSRDLGSGPADDPAGSRDLLDVGSADRVLAVDPGRRSRNS